jgi:hypothetical protein
VTTSGQYSDGVKKLTGLYNILKLTLIAWLVGTVLLVVVPILELASILDYDTLSMPLAIILLVTVSVFIFINIMTIVIFGMWIYRAAANIRDEANLAMTDSPRMAVGWYFIPLANLFKPYTAMREIWNASTANRYSLDQGNTTLTAWWAMWLISNITSNISLRLAMSSDSEATVQAGLYLDVVSGVTSIALYFAASKVLTAITAGQRQGLHLLAAE